MKKLHSFAFYALVAPVIALGSGFAFAEKSSNPDVEGEKQTTQRSMDTEDSGPSGNKMQADENMMSGQSGMQGKSYMNASPANGMQASNLIGADVRTTGDEEVGQVNDLIIDKDGQVVAVVIGVGGFLGLGEKNVAINWNQVTRSGGADMQALRIDHTREELQTAPAYKAQK